MKLRRKLLTSSCMIGPLYRPTPLTNPICYVHPSSSDANGEIGHRQLWPHSPQAYEEHYPLLLEVLSKLWDGRPRKVEKGNDSWPRACERASGPVDRLGTGEFPLCRRYTNPLGYGI